MKWSWLEGRFEGTDVFEGAPKVSDLGIFIPHSYNVQGLIFFHWEDVQPGLLEFRAYCGCDVIASLPFDEVGEVGEDAVDFGFVEERFDEFVDGGDALGEFVGS